MLRKYAKVEPRQEKIKVILNNGVCKNCLKKDNLLAVLDDGGSLSYCTECKENTVIFKYMTLEEYEIHKKNMIKKTSFDSYVNSKSMQSSI